VASRNPLTSGFYIGAEDSIPLGCDAVSLEEELSTFRNACFFRVKESIPEDMLLVILVINADVCDHAAAIIL
jgi:hypothetical protein